MEPQSPALIAERQRRLDALGPRPPWWRLLARRRWRKARAAIEAMGTSRFDEMLRAAYIPERIEALLAESPAFARLARVARKARAVGVTADGVRALRDGADEPPIDATPPRRSRP